MVLSPITHKKAMRIARTPLTKLHRARQRGSFERSTINAIVDATPLCHVGHLIDGQPVVTPTCHWRRGEILYWHGSRASRMIKAAAESPTCVTVTHLDGLVLARSAFHHSANYRSAMIFGQAQVVDNPADKLSALEWFLDKLFPGRWAQLRAPTRKEMNATTVLALPISEASAKIRTGPPNDDKEDMAADVWAGVVPLHMQAGQPEACPELPKGKRVPSYTRNLKIG